MSRLVEAGPGGFHGFDGPAYPATPEPARNEGFSVRDLTARVADALGDAGLPNPNLIQPTDIIIASTSVTSWQEEFPIPNKRLSKVIICAVGAINNRSSLSRPPIELTEILSFGLLNPPSDKLIKFDLLSRIQRRVNFAIPDITLQYNPQGNTLKTVGDDSNKFAFGPNKDGQTEQAIIFGFNREDRSAPRRKLFLASATLPVGWESVVKPDGTLDEKSAPKEPLPEEIAATPQEMLNALLDTVAQNTQPLEDNTRRIGFINNKGRAARVTAQTTPNTLVLHVNASWESANAFQELAMQPTTTADTIIKALTTEPTGTYEITIQAQIVNDQLVVTASHFDRIANAPKPIPNGKLQIPIEPKTSEPYHVSPAVLAMLAATIEKDSRQKAFKPPVHDGRKDNQRGGGITTSPFNEPFDIWKALPKVDTGRPKSSAERRRKQKGMKKNKGK